MIRKIKTRLLPFFVLLLFAEFDSFSQEIKLLEGQILADTISPANIHIVNLDLEKGTTSDNFGKFKIYAKAGDRILFSSVQFENREIRIMQTNLDSVKIESETISGKK